MTRRRAVHPPLYDGRDTAEPIADVAKARGLLETARLQLRLLGPATPGEPADKAARRRELAERVDALEAVIPTQEALLP